MPLWDGKINISFQTK